MATTEQQSVVYNIKVPVYGLNFSGSTDFEIQVVITNNRTKGYRTNKTVTIRPAGDGRGNQFNFTESDPKLVEAMAKALAEAHKVIENHEFKTPKVVNSEL